MADSPSAPAHLAGAQPTPDPDRWWTLGAVCVAVFMLLLDITIVNVALPDIAKALHSSFTDLQWVIDAYALSLAALLLTAGSMADRLGRRRIFAVGLVLFTAASLLCGLAGSPLMLNLARALQGIGGAAMFATSLALLAQAFTGRERGTAFGIWGATTGAAVAIGPLIGGVLTQSIGWEAIFFINVPIGAAAVWVTLTRVRESRDERARRIDWGGVVTFSAALFFLIFALVRGNAEGWGSPLIVGFLVAAVVLLVIFVALEARLEQPMLDLSLFRVPTFTGASIPAFALSASLFSMFLYLTLYLQNGLGYSPLQTGLRFLPFSLLSFVVAPIAGRLSARMPVRALIGAGMLLVAVSLAAMRGLDAGSSWTVLLPGFIIGGIGVGLVNPPLASTAIGVVEPRHSGMASGINTTFRQVGIATGTAAYGAVFQHVLQGKVTGAFPSGPGAAIARSLPVEAYAQGTAGPLARIPGGSAAFLGAFTATLDELFLIAAAVAAAGALGAFLLIRGRDFQAARDAAPASRTAPGEQPARPGDQPAAA